MVVLHIFLWQDEGGKINIWEGEELFKLMNNVGTITSGYRLAMNTFMLKILQSFHQRSVAL